MQILVKIPSYEKEVVLEIEPDHTVNAIRETICEGLGLPSNNNWNLFLNRYEIDGIEKFENLDTDDQSELALIHRTESHTVSDPVAMQFFLKISEEYNNGLVTSEAYNRLKSHYEDMVRQLKIPVKDLFEMIVSNLNHEYGNGSITEESYHRLKSHYEEKANDRMWGRLIGSSKDRIPIHVTILNLDETITVKVSHSNTVGDIIYGACKLKGLDYDSWKIYRHISRFWIILRNDMKLGSINPPICEDEWLDMTKKPPKVLKERFLAIKKEFNN